MSKSKIFGIGISKTGTTSLAAALTILGFKGIDHPNPKEYRKFLQGHYDFGVDSPFSIRFKELDERFPNSKFILTIRPNIKEWLKSVAAQHLKVPNNKMSNYGLEYRMERHGRLDLNIMNQLEVYSEHHIEVLDYFKERIGSDVLIYNVISGDGWERLCKFLDKPIPKSPFPHLNKDYKRSSRNGTV